MKVTVEPELRVGVVGLVRVIVSDPLHCRFPALPTVKDAHDKVLPAKSRVPEVILQAWPVEAELKVFAKVTVPPVLLTVKAETKVPVDLVYV